MIDAARWAAYALEKAVSLATMVGDGANVARWLSESRVLHERLHRIGVKHVEGAVGGFGSEQSIEELLRSSTWQHIQSQPWAFADSQRGIALAGDLVWSVCNLEWYDGTLKVFPNRIDEIRWWALVDYPIDDRRITLVWDGETLHSTYPVSTSSPLSQYDRIRVRGADEHSFNLHFDMIQLVESEVARRKPKEVVVHQYRPEFDTT